MSLHKEASVAQNSIYDPYASAALKESSLASPGLEENHLGRLYSAPPRQAQGASAYRSVSWILGFKERYSLLCFIVFGGALAGFCLARTMMLSPHNVKTLTVPGEWFWYSQALYKPNILVHIYATILAGMLAVFQFLPVIRRRKMVLHRINGYVVLTLLIPGTVCGTIVGRRAFGGELNVQSGFYFLGSLIVTAALMGILNVKRTRRHRKWMLRTVTYVSAPITARLAMLCAREIITDVGSYYSVWRCDEILSVLQDDSSLQTSFPQCVDLGSHVAVHAAMHSDHLQFGSAVRATFGMSLWIAILIHVVGVEFYIHLTESENQHRRGFVLERLDDDLNARAPDDR